ncbi:hypothetical protein J5N97_008156 [Dioscorea zingiberensis]|uniref:Protein kinase domain-containing protein n=1 Tax=Dioscorea zingiberensis TaxID=325984 RepID=A0A9D5DG65_9LILI|nr:hypothetical protein J5N97_008156 [Dioscorea zingiberensis]
MEENGSLGSEADGGPLDSFRSWNPSGGAFRPYLGPQRFGRRLPAVGVKRPMVRKLTRDIIGTYQLCDPGFKCAEPLNVKRFLTSPSVAVLNDGFDNANSDMILYANFVLVNFETRQRYIVHDMLGQGTFGQVAKCWVPETDHFVAVKIIKNHPAYYQQGLAEVSILSLLNNKFDPDDKHNIVRMLDYFVFRHHLCIAFEMLGPNLFELIKSHKYNGFPLNLVQMFSKQILRALIVIKDAGIIHCDLKPENILVSTSMKAAEIKVIDFGSACLEQQTIYSYIQSRYYRSPEVLLGCPYTTAIDMWSFGCIVAELFLGIPLFPGASEFDILRRMIDTLGAQPPDDLLRKANNRSKFFKQVGSIYRMEDDEICKRSSSTFQFLTEEEYEARESKKPVIGKKYYSYVKLEDIVVNYPYKTNLPEEISKENRTRLALVDFLRGLVQFDPEKRWSPLQASFHPFVTGEPFLCPYRPPQQTPQIPVIRTVAVNHNPVEGHWVVAGLSPQAFNLNRYPPQSSPYLQTNLSYGSYSSMGSYGSYNDNAALRNGYGSYGDVNSMYAYQPPVGSSGLTIQGQFGGSFLGASPDARGRPLLSFGNGFVVSPNTGDFAPMSLGVSPSQYTPPSSQMQIPNMSPGKFGPTTRVTFHGSPLGKGAAVSQYKNWGTPGTSHMQPHENPSQNWHSHHSDGVTYGYSDVYARGVAASPHSAHSTSNFSSFRQHKKCGNTLFSGPSSSTYQKFSACDPLSQTSEPLRHKPESSSPPDPADWDPNYCDDLLFQEDTPEISSITFGSYYFIKTQVWHLIIRTAGRFQAHPFFVVIKEIIDNLVPTIAWVIHTHRLVVYWAMAFPGGEGQDIQWQPLYHQLLHDRITEVSVD